MRMRTRRPQKLKPGAIAPQRLPSKTPRPKRTISQAMNDAAKILPKKGQTPPKNVFTGMTGRPAPKRRLKRKPIGTPRPRTTTPKPPETRQLADMRRMSPDIDTRMKQLSIDRGRSKGAKSTIGDRSTSADEKMAALARERRAKGQYKSRSRVAADARKKAMAEIKKRAMARATPPRRVRGNTAKPNLRGIASMRVRRRKSRI